MTHTAPADVSVRVDGLIDRQEASLDEQLKVLNRLTRRISGAITHPPKLLTTKPYLTTRTEDFWERHLEDLVADALALGLARYRGLSPIGELLQESFDIFAPLSQGYIGLGAHVNALALESWRPERGPQRGKVEALVQLHARSLVLLDEVLVLVFSGFPSGAEAISRTLYEVAITASFLNRFRAELAERYLASHVIELWRSKSELRPGRGTAQARTWKAFEQELDEQYALVVRKYGDSIKSPYGWAWPRFAREATYSKKQPRHLKFADIQAAVGRLHQRGRYRENSHHVHAMHLGNIKTLVHGEPATLTLGPRPYGFASTAVDAIRDTQTTAEALLRSCGRSSANRSIHYWLEALDQLSYLLCDMVDRVGSKIDEVFERGNFAAEKNRGVFDAD